MGKKGVLTWKIARAAVMQGRMTSRGFKWLTGGGIRGRDQWQQGVSSTFEFQGLLGEQHAEMPRTRTISPIS